MGASQPQMLGQYLQHYKEGCLLMFDAGKLKEPERQGLQGGREQGTHRLLPANRGRRHGLTAAFCKKHCCITYNGLIT